MDEIAQLPDQDSDQYQSGGIAVVDQAEDARAWTLEQLILIAGQTSIARCWSGAAELVGMLVRSVPEQVCDAHHRDLALEPLHAGQAAEFVTHCLAAGRRR